jgi:hypothetical protein
MNRISITFAFLLSLFTTQNLFSQDSDEHEHKFCFHFDDEEYFAFDFKGRPRIETSYGISSLHWHNFGASFEKVALAEIRLGYTSQKTNKYSEQIVNFNDVFFFRK